MYLLESDENLLVTLQYLLSLFLSFENFGSIQIHTTTFDRRSTATRSRREYRLGKLRLAELSTRIDLLIFYLLESGSVTKLIFVHVYRGCHVL